MMDIAVIGLLLAAVSICDRRTWPFLAVIGLAWAMTTAFDASLPILSAIFARVLVDALGAFLSGAVESRQREWRLWMGGVRVTFCLMLLLHACFWIARAFGLDIWSMYAEGLNTLALLQLGFLAWPGIMRLLARRSKQEGGQCR
jgi:hypothetical protein